MSKANQQQQSTPVQTVGFDGRMARFSLPNGQEFLYQGEVGRDGKPKGQGIGKFLGVMNTSFGLQEGAVATYIGEWKAGAMHGEGKLCTVTGFDRAGQAIIKSESGFWSKGTFIPGRQLQEQESGTRGSLKGQEVSERRALGEKITSEFSQSEAEARLHEQRRLERERLEAKARERLNLERRRQEVLGRYATKSSVGEAIAAGGEGLATVKPAQQGSSVSESHEVGARTAAVQRFIEERRQAAVFKQTTLPKLQAVAKEELQERSGALREEESEFADILERFNQENPDPTARRAAAKKVSGAPQRRR
jgi:hypothetical protein